MNPPRRSPARPALVALPAARVPARLAGPAAAAPARGIGLSGPEAGATRPEYRARGTVYVEALRGSDYELRLTNPLGVRVAVALSVDGLNTVDARRTDAKSATKWVLEPYQTIVLSGWQVSSATARRFTFTGERDSYGALLGQTNDLGVIEAVYYREKSCEPPPVSIWPFGRRDTRPEEKSRSARPAPSGAAAEGSVAQPRNEPSLSDEYAATGMGDRTDHQVRRIDLELESRPAATVRIRYEFRPQLVKLGVLPTEPRPWPLSRRERATGFDGSFCPEPGVVR